MELAAMASAAVPGLTPTGVAGSPDDAADFDAALLVDDAGRRWRVRSPKHLEASMRLETELLVLRTFVPAVRAELPFVLPYVAGTVRQGELCTFVYSHLPGATRSIDTLMTSGRAVAAEIGRAMAAVHALPRELVTRADLPSYTANEFRQRRLNELDQAATTGLIPSVLLRRWEHALEDVSLWRFKPTVVHGDLHEDNILLTGERVSAVTGWTDLRVGDPADDFAWLIAANDPRFTETVHGAYLEASTDPEDPHLIRRAALSAEFALAQWLVRGVAAENSTMVDEAVEMLATLEEDVLEQEAADQRAGQYRAAADAVPRTVNVPVDADAPADAPADARAAAKPDSAKVTVAPIEPAGEQADGTEDGPDEGTEAGIEAAYTDGDRLAADEVAGDSVAADDDETRASGSAQGPGLAEVIVLPARGAAVPAGDTDADADTGSENSEAAAAEAEAKPEAAEPDAQTEDGAETAPDAEAAVDTAPTGADGAGTGSDTATTALPLIPVRKQ
ncbi:MULTISPECIES: phosphotransferase [unclassified Arthrobacter]